MSQRDYYDILGISRGATADEIKKAYRKLARSHHPDVNPGDKGAEAKFKEAQSAYDVLGDPEKRKRYDIMGHDAFSGMGSAGPRSGATEWSARHGGQGAENVDFSQFFGGGAEGGDGGGLFEDLIGRFGGGRGRRAGPRRGPDVEATLSIPFETAVLGGSTQVNLAKSDGTQESISIKIPVGADTGTKLRLKGRGGAGETAGTHGDLTITLEVEPHHLFKRDGDNLTLEVPVSIDEAVLGAKVEVPTISGTKVAVPVPSGASSGQKLRVRGKGVPARGQAHAGDLFVVVKIVTPKGIDDEGQRLIRAFAEHCPLHPRDGLW